MKKYISILVMFLPYLIYSCAPPQSGQRVWNIATKNIFITQTISSKLEDISSIDTIAVYSALDQLLSEIITTESKVLFLSQEIDILQNDLKGDLSNIEQIHSDIRLMESVLELLDINSVFTALGALQTTVVSAMDLLNTDLEIIESNIDLLTASQIQYFQTVASQLDKLDEDVTTINSVLEALSAQFSLITFGSITDLIQRDLVTLESNVDFLADQLAGGFQGTFSVLEQNLELAQTIESLVDTLDVMDESDLTGTYSLLDQLEISVQTMDSLADLLIDTFENIESAIDILGSALDESVSKYMFVESRTSLLVQKIEDLVNDPSFSQVDYVTSLLDRDISLLESAYAADLPALTTSIESKLDHIIVQQHQQISDLDTIASVLDAVADIPNGTTISKLEIANSLLDDTLDDAFTTESYLDPATHIEQLFTIANNAQDLGDQLSYVAGIVPDISSKMMLVDDLLAATDSTLDIITIIAESNLDDTITLESMLDRISSVSQPSGSITSMLAVINSQEDVVISKLAVASSLIAAENSEAQGLITDFQSTWTILRSIDTKLAQAYNSLSLTDVTIDSVSYSPVFTVIDTIVRNEGTVNSQVDVYNSMVNALTNSINVDFNGVFTALNAVITDVNNNIGFVSSMLSTVSSKLSVVQTELGFPIYQRNIPLTITTPGRYYLAENINYGSATTAITINTSNVTIDLNGRTLNYTGAGTVTGILVNNVSNTKIINGTVQGFTTIATGAGVSTNVIINNVTIAKSAINFAGSGRNHKVYNVTLLGLKSPGPANDSIAIVQHTNMDIQDCILINHAGLETRGNATNVFVQGCYLQDVNNNAAFGFNGTINNFVTKNNIVVGTGQGWRANGSLTGCDIINSYFIAGTETALNLGGTTAVIKNNSIINHVVGMTSLLAFSNNYVGFNTLIQNTSGNINIGGANTYVGNFAFNTNAAGVPNNTNYSVSTSNLTGKFVTISQRTGISGLVAPTYWHNINMLP